MATQSSSDSGRDPRVDQNGWRPRQCVWELTLACDQRCAYCGSKAGKARKNELSTERGLELIAELASLGCEIVSLSGGEPTLRDDWDTLAAACVRRGMMVNMVTHGVFRREEQRDNIIGRAVQAGLCNVGVSIDGPPEVHDQLRGQGTFAHAFATVEHLARAGMPPVVMTTVGQRNLPHLAEMLRIAVNSGAAIWRLQLAKPMGRLTLSRDIVLEPRQILALVEELTALKGQCPIPIAIGDSIGYFGPQGDCLRAGGWRSEHEIWRGCQAGLRVVGIEANGAVKGCLSLQAKRGDEDPFVEGNLSDASLETLWYRPTAFGFNRNYTPQQLRGACRGCSKRNLCRGGATCMATAVYGRVGENPYCYHRWSSLAGQPFHRPLVRSMAATTTLAAFAFGPAGCGGTVDASTENTRNDGATYDASNPSKETGADSLEASQELPDWDVGPEADVTPQDAVAEYDCSNVECYVQSDYVAPSPPKEVLKACCCQNLCSDCDYGVPPPVCSETSDE